MPIRSLIISLKRLTGEIMPDEILVEVAYALPEEQIIISIKVPTKFNVQQAIEKSGIQKKFSDIDLSKNKVGIFGKQTTARSSSE